MPLNCTRTYLQSSGQQLTQHDFCFFLNNKYIEPRAFHITIVMRINSMCNSLQACRPSSPVKSCPTLRFHWRWSTRGAQAGIGGTYMHELPRPDNPRLAELWRTCKSKLCRWRRRKMIQITQSYQAPSRLPLLDTLL